MIDYTIEEVNAKDKYKDVNLPNYLREDLDAYIKCIENNDKLNWDLFWCELYGSLNSAETDGIISSNLADSIRKEWL